MKETTDDDVKRCFSSRTTFSLETSSTISDLSENCDVSADKEFGYHQTLMCGSYSRALAETAKERVHKLKRRDSIVSNKSIPLQHKYETDGCCYTSWHVLLRMWELSFDKIGEDWFFLAALGIIMALISYGMDITIEVCTNSRLWLYIYFSDNVMLQYIAWVTLPVILVLFAANFVQCVAPQAIGSGIPEMKTILRGIVLKEYLTAKTLLAKVVGLTATLGSGMPLGKEGPFVHIASIVANLLSKLVTSFRGIYGNESRRSEMLEAACAVGVACCFGSPIGGVLFSIEVTSEYFAVKNYWRGFFSAVCGALVFRLIAIWFDQEETIVAVFLTDFKVDFPYDPQELFVFIFMGIICGLGGALYVYLHRCYVNCMRENSKLTDFLKRRRFIYPLFVSFILASLTFPPGLGQFQAADISTHKQIEILFSNYPWIQDNGTMSFEQKEHLKHWVTPWTSIFVNLTIYMALTFSTSILAATLPVPAGVLIPTFKVGAAFGRLIGEAMHIWFPGGIGSGKIVNNIMPGGYATVGAAAFCGAVTHTISISVIVFEMTGQITHCIPVLIAVLVSNAVAQLLQPSCYDSIILIKNLPYLPEIIPGSSGSKAYTVFVEEFMVRDVKYIWKGITHHELNDILKKNEKIRSFPLVDDPNQMILLGSVQRYELDRVVKKQHDVEREIVISKMLSSKKIEKECHATLKQTNVSPTVPANVLVDVCIDAKNTDKNNGPNRLVSHISISSTDEEKCNDNWESNDLVPGPECQTERRESRFSITPAVDNAPKDKVLSLSESIKTSQENLMHTSYVDEDVKSANPKRVQMKPVSFRRRSSSTSDLDACKSSLRPKRNNIHKLKENAPLKPILKKNKFYNTGKFQDVVWDQDYVCTNTIASPDSFSYFKSRRPIDNWDVLTRRIQNCFSIKNIHEHNDAATTTADSFERKKVDWFTIHGSLSQQELKEMCDEQMNQQVIISDKHIDPAPFQLVEKTSLYKVHSLFLMLGINHAYVTAIGKLIGVVGVGELRKAIENARVGHNYTSMSKVKDSYIPNTNQNGCDKEEPSSKFEHKINIHSFDSTDSTNVI